MTRVTLTLEPELAAALRAAAAAAAASRRSPGGRSASLSSFARKAFASYLTPRPANTKPQPRHRTHDTHPPHP